VEAAKKKNRKQSITNTEGLLGEQLRQRGLSQLKRIEMAGVMQKYDEAEELMAGVDAKIVNVEFDDAYRELRRVMLGFYYASMKEGEDK
jgi:hypothetical protein